MPLLLWNVSEHYYVHINFATKLLAVVTLTGVATQCVTYVFRPYCYCNTWFTSVFYVQRLRIQILDCVVELFSCQL